MSTLTFWMFAALLFFALIGFVYDVPLFQHIAEPMFWMILSLFIVSCYLTVVRNSEDSGGSVIGFIIVMFVFLLSLAVLATI